MNPPENGLINANKQPLADGYVLNTTLEYSCLNGFILVGSKINLCVFNNTIGYWKGGTAKCLPNQTIASTVSVANYITTIKRKQNDSVSSIYM